MRFWLVHFQESTSWEPLNGFECEFQNDHLWRSTFYWNSMGNNIFIIFSRNTQQNTTKLGTFVNFMCLQVSCAKSIKKWRKITTTKNQIQPWPFIYKPGEHRQQSKGEKTQNYEPNEFDRMRVKQFLSETVAMHPQYWSRVVRVSSTNLIPYASDAMQGRIQDFKLGGAHLKKWRRTEGGAKNFGVFRVKKHDFMSKNHIFSNFRGGARRVRPPPWIRPCNGR
jgi:hypothetical protein